MESDVQTGETRALEISTDDALAEEHQVKRSRTVYHKISTPPGRAAATKHSLDSEADSSQPSTRQRIAAVGLKDGQEIDLSPNEDQEEVRASNRDPVIYENTTEFTDEELNESMKKEMRSLEDFDTKEDVAVSSLEPSIIDQAMTLLWVHVWKGFVKSRLCVRGYRQVINDLDDTYASTPVIYVLRILLIIALARGWMIYFFDISTAFLHAPLTGDPVYVWPPKEFYPGGDILWRLKKAMYGLRSAPKDWQVHFATILLGIGFIRLQSDPNVYMHSEFQVYILAYVDDLMIIGALWCIQKILPLLKEKFLIKSTGELNSEGAEVDFLGRHLQRLGDLIKFMSKDGYLDEDFDQYGLAKCRAATTPGTSSIKRPIDGCDLLDEIEHRLYRRTVGRLQ